MAKIENKERIWSFEALERMGDDVRRWHKQVPEQIRKAEKEEALIQRKLEERYRREQKNMVFDRVADAPQVTIGDPYLLPWPKIMRKVLDYMKANEHKPQPHMQVTAALSMFATLIGKRYKLSNGLRPQLYVTAVAKSGRGKDGPLKAIQKIMTAFDDYCADKSGAAGQHQPRLASKMLATNAAANGPAMYELMKGGYPKLVQVDEMGSILSSGNSKSSSSPEKQTKEAMLTFWSKSDHKLVSGVITKTDLKEGSVAELHYPHFNLYGTTTHAKLLNNLNPEDITTGLGNRMIFVFDDSKPMKSTFFHNEQPVPQDLLDDLYFLAAGRIVVTSQAELNKMQTEDTMALRYTDELGQYAAYYSDFGGILDEDNLCYPVPVSDEAVALLDSFGNWQVEQEALLEEQGDFTSALYPRASEMALRIALICAVIENPDDPCVEPNDIQNGIALTRWSIEGASEYLAANLGVSESTRLSKKIEEYIRKGGIAGVTHSRFANRFWREDPQELNRALKALIEAKRVKKIVTPTKGRPKTILVSLFDEGIEDIDI